MFVSGYTYIQIPLSQNMACLVTRRYSAGSDVYYNAITLMEPGTIYNGSNHIIAL